MLNNLSGDAGSGVSVSGERIHDVLILGSGFGGSLLAAILSRGGMNVAVVDRLRHPRFAIGESSTPLANQTLWRIAQVFQLPELLPLTKYGSWKRVHPELMCGRKRGFTYFDHCDGTDLSPASFDDRRMLVAAAGSDEFSDTHWLRSDVDQFLFRLAEQTGADCHVLDQYSLHESAEGWLLKGGGNRPDLLIRSSFVIDATGSPNGILKHLGVEDHSDLLKTASRSLYAHFSDLPTCESLLRQQGIHVSDFPYSCDAAAVHHLLPFGWMWQLRFDDNTVSAGMMIDSSVNPASNAAGLTVDQEWAKLLDSSSFLKKQFTNVRIVRPESGLQRTGRIQRLAAQAAGVNWAALPNTVGFIDPLHSTGIAHTLMCVERISSLLLAGQRDLFSWSDYSKNLINEICFVDELVEGCYAALPSFSLWCDWTMLYFAAVTSMEQAGQTACDDFRAHRSRFLQASDPRLRQVVRDARNGVSKVREKSWSEARFRDWLRAQIEPWNQVGLLNDSVGRLYTRTAAPE